MSTVTDHTTSPTQKQTQGPKGSTIGRVAGGLLLDSGLAVAAYFLVLALGHGMFAALLAGMVVAGIRAAYVIIRRRSVDGFVLFILFTFVVGLGLALIGGTPRWLLAKDSIGTAASALLFAVTLFVGRPMMFHLSQRFAAPTAELRQEWNRRWESSAGFRHLFRHTTLVWAITLGVEAVVKLILVLMLPVAVMAPLLPFVTPLLITGLLIWTIRHSRRAEQRPQPVTTAVS